MSAPGSLRGAIGGEAIKMSRRPAVYALSLILLAALVLLIYLVQWFIRAEPKESFYPANMVRQALSVTPVLGGALALVLGALAVGSEYNWGTFKMLLTQRPARGQVFLAKAIVLALTLAVLAVLNLAAAAAVSVVLALVAHQPLRFPAASQVLASAGVCWLIWNWYAAFGGFLGYLFRQSALAIGVGLAYVLVIESLIFGILGRAGTGKPGSLLMTVEKFFPGPNAQALVQSFGSPAPGELVKPLVGPAQASLVLAGYFLVALIFAASVLRRRDVN